MPNKPSFGQKYPHFVNLPKNSKSPSGSIYKRFDIVSQGKALTSQNAANVIRSAEPFVLSIQVNGKVKEVHSRIKPSKP